MYKTILKSISIFALTVFMCTVSLQAGECPEGFVAKKKYTHGEMILCMNTGDECCVEAAGGGGIQ